VWEREGGGGGGWGEKEGGRRLAEFEIKKTNKQTNVRAMCTIQAHNDL